MNSLRFPEILTFSSNNSLVLQPLQCIHCNAQIFQFVHTAIIHSPLFSKCLSRPGAEINFISRLEFVSKKAQAHLLKGIINIRCCFEELLSEHVDITLSDVTRHFVFGSLTLLLQFTFSRNWLKE